MPPPSGRDADVVIVGAGIAGASAAYFLAPHASVILLEREEQPGYHTTGRSAALFAESYGNATVRALTRASRAFFTTPPAGFSSAALLAPRGHLIFSRADQKPQLDAATADIEATGTRLERLTGTQVRALVPALHESHAHAGALDPGAQDVDVHALLHGFLRGARAQGVRVHTNAALQAAEFSGRRWRLATTAGEFSAGILVNAGGAWADEVARASGVSALGLSPLRRTVIVFDSARHTGAQTWPMSVSADESLYFRPEAGGFLASPADETPSPPCDAQPEELDIALVIDRLQTATTFDIRRVRAKWAGLRTFAADRSLIAGFDMHQRAFFWLAGQGGYGIQTAPAMGILAAAVIGGKETPRALAEQDLEADGLAPRRFTITGVANKAV
ncbi:MAG: FAD-dependent oxidoreductase [Betaproteobacteria bacterium RIFCSPLOWO2_02_FULL_66_14]|nr:MAG: FAD-dependent oxidoreductase [Betaproteobacteria bacterium RIFCSPLOWO2_02_FULL_66_14]